MKLCAPYCAIGHYVPLTGLGTGGLSKNLRASLFDEDLSNGPNFSRIHLARQYLLRVSVVKNFQVADIVLITQAKPKKPVIVEVSDTDTSEEESIGRRGIRVEK